MRRPRAGLANLHSGGPGQPSGPTMGVCLQWLDAAGTKGGGSHPDGGPERLSFPPGSYGAGDRKAAMERREAPAFLATGARQDGKTGAPLGAPFPRLRGREQGKTADPGPLKNTGGGALANGLFEN